MLMTYAQYTSRGGTMSQEDYAVWEPRAEVQLNHWTLNRLKNSEVVAELKELDEYETVLVVLAWLVDRMESIEEARDAKGKNEEVTSFNNGVNSFSFGGTSTSSTVTAAEQQAYAHVCRYLPVELISVDVDYNHAG